MVGGSKVISYVFSSFSFQLDRMQFYALLASEPVDIDLYLPIKTSEEAELFCENYDGMLEQRKTALMRRVYGASDVENMTTFVASVADILFHESYQISHRWPAKGYFLLLVI